MNLGQARRSAAAALSVAGIEDAELEAEVLLRDAMGGVDRAAFFARIDEAVRPEVAAAYDKLIARRLSHEPAAYITGHREFFGIEFGVTPAALIPRPETELLVEATLAHLGAARPSTGSGRAASARGEPVEPRVVDVGAGCGAIAVAVAANHPTVRVVATDVSASALELASENARRFGLEGRIDLVRTDLLAAMRPSTLRLRSGQAGSGRAAFDVVVANPPYVRTADWDGLAPEIREHEPRLALDGGPDGLTLVRRLLAQAAPFVAAGAALYVEIGDDEGEAAQAAARAAMPANARIEVRPDLAGRDRVLAVEYMTDLTPSVPLSARGEGDGGSHEGQEPLSA